jgi:hypothetical protein
VSPAPSIAASAAPLMSDPLRFICPSYWFSVHRTRLTLVTAPRNSTAAMRRGFRKTA